MCVDDLLKYVRRSIWTRRLIAQSLIFRFGALLLGFPFPQNSWWAFNVTRHLKLIEQFSHLRGFSGLSPESGIMRSLIVIVGSQTVSRHVNLQQTLKSKVHVANFAAELVRHRIIDSLLLRFRRLSNHRTRCDSFFFWFPQRFLAPIARFLDSSVAPINEFWIGFTPRFTIARVEFVVEINVHPCRFWKKKVWLAFWKTEMLYEPFR